MTALGWGATDPAVDSVEWAGGAWDAITMAFPTTHPPQALSLTLRPLDGPVLVIWDGVGFSPLFDGSTVDTESRTFVLRHRAGWPTRGTFALEGETLDRWDETETRLTRAE